MTSRGDGFRPRLVSDSCNPSAPLSRSRPPCSGSLWNQKSSRSVGEMPGSLAPPPSPQLCLRPAWPPCRFPFFFLLAVEWTLQAELTSLLRFAIAPHACFSAPRPTPSPCGFELFGLRTLVFLGCPCAPGSRQGDQHMTTWSLRGPGRLSRNLAGLGVERWRPLRNHPERIFLSRGVRGFCVITYL